MRTYADQRERKRIRHYSMHEISGHCQDNKTEEDLETTQNDMPQRGVDHPRILTSRGSFGVRPRLLRDSSYIYRGHGDFRGCSTLPCCYYGVFWDGCFVVMGEEAGREKETQKTDETKKGRRTGTPQIDGASRLLNSSQILGSPWV